MIILPFLGVFISLIARGGRCRNARSKTAQQKLSFDAAVREAAGASGGDVTSQLTQLPDLKAQGVLTDAEFDSQKAQILVAS